MSIFPNYGGRFAFTERDCTSLVAGTQVAMGPIRRSFPAPAAGMTLAQVPQMCELYGVDAVLLIGGALHRGSDLVSTCQRFGELVEAAMSPARRPGFPEGKPHKR